MAAAVVLLAAAVLLHFATPHHSTTVPVAAAPVAQAVEAEPRKLLGAAAVSARAHTGSGHHAETADAPAWLPRAAQCPSEPRVVDKGSENLTTTSLGCGQAQPPTAREAWNPTAGTTPTPSTLQTFRC
ncbi:hypothetical protein [Streptomyces pseudovenezuelae]|uniref:hypothetical protein n=1 Tax=Streptomyces pseudovenezuelae TaxID=67350 RepID=UPI002E34B96F|nr:hypothetical protein [Streptomyces pseudovenezuelae]